MILYGVSLSPYVRKVLAFAAEKGVELEVKPVAPGSQDPDFVAASPFGKMPGLRDGDFVVSDSSAIVAYLEARHPEPALIPSGPKARARAIWFEEYTDTMLIVSAAKIFFNRVVAPRFFKRPGDEAAIKAGQEELPRLLDYLEGQIPASGFLVEDRLTLADLAVASPFANLAHAGHALDEARYPKVTAYTRAILARPSFAALIEGERQMLAR